MTSSLWASLSEDTVDTVAVLVIRGLGAVDAILMRSTRR